MDSPLSTILVPVIDEVPVAAIAYAEMLAQAYRKPVSLLFFNAELFQQNTYQHSTTVTSKPIAEGIQSAVLTQDSVMVVWQTPKSRKALQLMLNIARDWRIPYFFIPRDFLVSSLAKLYLSFSYLVEDREKGIWARSLFRVFGCSIELIEPNDKGSRARQNAEHVASFLTKYKIPFNCSKSKRPSFKVDFELALSKTLPSDLLLVTASRDYGLDDYLLGPRERRVLRHSRVPAMLLNPRGDLYVLCGD